MTTPTLSKLYGEKLMADIKLNSKKINAYLVRHVKQGLKFVVPFTFECISIVAKTVLLFCWE